jgi:hypothetical protein
MSMFRYPRSAFTPETLSMIYHTMDEVLGELLADGILSSSNLDAGRTRLAQKIIAFASSGWSATQIKQLLLRTYRNERSAASRITRSPRSGLCHSEE